MEENENKENNISPKISKCCSSGCRKLSVTNWLDDVNVPGKASDYVEVQFKNTHKGYFINNNNLPLKENDIVAVETSPGHDIGYVTLVGELVLKQMAKNNISFDRYEFKRVYRLAKPSDIEKWDEVRKMEHPTMIRAREIAKKLKLDMKIGDVEYQGDGNKAIFYYIADKRVDFRQLIKDLASEFAVRIEMRQIGARQEAGQIGGIGPCGREICCSKWNSNFASVNTSAARIQELSLNPEKLTGMCAKLKCCLNYEVDMYHESLKAFPSKNKKLETEEGIFRHMKNDALKGMITYVLNKKNGLPLFATIPVDRAKEIITANANGDVPERILEEVIIKKDLTPTYENVVGQDELTRFDKTMKSKKRRPKKRKPKEGGAAGPKDPVAKKTIPKAGPKKERPSNPKRKDARPSGPRKAGDGPQGNKPANQNRRERKPVEKKNVDIKGKDGKTPDGAKKPNKPSMNKRRPRPKAPKNDNESPKQ